MSQVHIFQVLHTHTPKDNQRQLPKWTQLHYTNSLELEIAGTMILNARTHTHTRTRTHTHTHTCTHTHTRRKGPTYPGYILAVFHSKEITQKSIWNEKSLDSVGIYSVHHSSQLISKAWHIMTQRVRIKGYLQKYTIQWEWMFIWMLLTIILTLVVSWEIHSLAVQW